VSYLNIPAAVALICLEVCGNPPLEMLVRMRASWETRKKTILGPT
jgi:hypothetical protein